VIPIHLKLSGFLSYRDAVELDFNSFNLACISGQNGAGKSSLLDAITWALFGQARKRDESVVNLQSKAAEVALTFGYEENIYRVIRALPRGKSTTLEFQILDNGRQTKDDNASSVVSGPLSGNWRPLTERTVRDTQARIENTLRLDYETFVNAAFFLQGRADQFAQQSPSQRKEILSNILGLGDWEIYKDRAAVRRKSIESELDSVNGRVAEINAELDEEPVRVQRLGELEAELKHMSVARKTQEAALANVKQVRAALDKQKELVRKLGEALSRAETSLSGLRSRLAVKQTERATYAELFARAADVESAYAAWQSARAEVERMDKVAAEFREHDERRQPLLREIESERARLEQEQETLRNQYSVISDQSSIVSGLETELASAELGLAEANKKSTERETLQKQVQEARERQAEMRAENESLRREMDELKTRISKLEAAEGVACPLCGQPLSPEHRESTLGQLRYEGKSKGDQWRANKSAMEELAEKIKSFDANIASSKNIGEQRMAFSNTVAQLTERIENLKQQAADWKKVGAKRLAEVEKLLRNEKCAAEARKQLAKLDKELAKLGYDAAAHDAARRTEVQARSAEAELRNLESARAAIGPLDDEIKNLKSQIENQQSMLATQQSEFDDAAATLASAETSAPDLDSVEQTLFDLQEQENRLNQEVGAARQKVTVLADLRKRKKKLEVEREEFALQIGQYKTLERAFGKDGVPALLVEQALPEIEAKANELLDRLSDGTMSMRFVTQSAYKDKKREDLKETLDIQISDGAGVRDYEMYSGGEAFRANFAIRLALSEVLARRKGARLQTLVIDEGFGSQDAQGRQRLIESINAVKDDFAKILIITHLDELKDVFPTRIEVEKTETGSTVRVIG
jgi:DNA repair protein SbcC/Rad50